jgi:hypothetical protein
MATTDSYRPASGTVRVFAGLALLGAVTLVVGLIQDPDRTWANLLLLGNYLVGLALGGLTLLALYYVTGARWIEAARPVPEAMTYALPVAAVLLAAVLLLRPSLYSWWTAGAAENTEPPFRRFWLNRPFFLIRTVLYFAVWAYFAISLIRNPRRQVASSEPAAANRNTRLSAGFLVVLGITCWLATYDWLMSLEPDWASTMYAVYNFAGLFLSSLAAAAILVIALRRYALSIDEDRVHDLGAMLFGFSSFWMYTWFFQYFLIWYVNNPEETIYYVRRAHGNWQALMIVSLVLNWAIPFLILLPRAAKSSSLILGTAAVSILAGRWVDLLLMVGPSQGEDLATFGLLEMGLSLGAVGLFGLGFCRAFSTSRLGTSPVSI